MAKKTPLFTAPEHFGNDWTQYRPVTRVMAKRVDEPFEIKTLEGERAKGEPGQYAVSHGPGDLTIYDEDHFLRNYEVDK